MLNRIHCSSKVLSVSLALAVAATFAKPMGGQEVPAIHVGNTQVTGVPEDWTHHHLAFSKVGTEQEAIKNGTHEQWLRIVNDPRYVMQELKKKATIEGPAGVDAAYRAKWSDEAAGREPGLDASGPVKSPVQRKKKESPLKQDWNETVGATTAPGAPTFPAKWSYDTTAASCANDFVIYPTAGSGTQASIIAYYNLYSGCTTGTVPAVDWAYNTGGTVNLSPVFYITGSEIAFVQTSGGVASLVLLRIPLTPPGTGTLAAPITPNLASSAANFYSGTSCATPCMFKIAFNGGKNDTWSSPYYDYTDDTIFVGDSAGKLHKFFPVFTGAPAEVTTSWPVQLNYAIADTGQVSSPVYDGTSGYVFVGTTLAAAGTGSGYLYSVGSGNQGTTSGSIHGSTIQIDGTWGVRDAPLVDSTAGEVYVFAGNTPAGYNAIFEFPTSFSGASVTGTEKVVSTTSAATGTAAYQFSGTFDNTYYANASPTGNIYMCGTAAPSALYQIAVTNSVMGTVTTGPTLSSTVGATTYYGRCSPVSEFFNPSVGSTPATTATGTVTIETDPATWAGTHSVTVGSVTYTFTTGTLSGTDVVQVNAGGGTAGHETRTTQNLRAAIDGLSSECYSTPPCYGSGITAANAQVTHPAGFNTNTITLTGTTSGPSGDFTLSEVGTTGDITVAETDGVAATTGTDYLFLSVFAGGPTGCTASATEGCVVSYDVTTPSSFSSALAPGGTLNITSTEAAPTSGIIVDNAVPAGTGTGKLNGASQIYFLTQDTAGTSPCSGVCAVQAAQSAP